MPDLFNFSEEMQEYFDSLPAILQESIAQSGAKINSVEDMKQLEKNFTESQFN